MTEVFTVFTLIVITVGVLLLGGVVTAHPARSMLVRPSVACRVVHSADRTDGAAVKPVPLNLAPNVIQPTFCGCYQCMGKDRCWRARGPPEHDLRRTERGRFVVVNPRPCY